MVSGSKEVASGSDRKIPSTSATQCADNVCRPFWSFKETSTASDDFFDCYVAFKELNCHEYMWDWKGRKLDEVLVMRLMQHYRKFFRKRQLGRDFFVTFRVDSSFSLEELGRLYMAIINSNAFAQRQDFHPLPLFEVAPSVTASSSLVKFSNLYNESVGIAAEKLKQDCNPKVVSILPAHDFGSDDWYSQLKVYLDSVQSSFRRKLDHFRPLIPRSSLADGVGFVAAALATRRSLSSYASFSRITGVKSYPVVDAGPLMFRGGLNPSSLKSFMENCPGARSVTITPAFRYDYGLEGVKESISALNRMLPRNRPVEYSREEISRLLVVERIFVKHFEKALSALPKLDVISDRMKLINSNAGEERRTSFSLYSLGVPPELLGTGNAILECIKEGVIKDLEYFYPNVKEDLVRAGALLNKENLRLLSETHKGWQSLLSEVKLIQDYTDSALGPDSTDSFIHRNHTSNVFHLWSTKRKFSRDLLAAARFRHCLG